MIGWWEPGGRLGWELLYDFLIKTLWRRICFLDKWDLLVWAKGFTWDSFSVKYLPCRLLNTGQNMAAVNYTFPWDFKNRFPPQLFFWARTQIGMTESLWLWKGPQILSLPTGSLQVCISLRSGIKFRSIQRWSEVNVTLYPQMTAWSEVKTRGTHNLTRAWA